MQSLKKYFQELKDQFTHYTQETCKLVLYNYQVKYNLAQQQHSSNHM
jgi:hypothetical protein